MLSIRAPIRATTGASAPASRSAPFLRNARAIRILAAAMETKDSKPAEPEKMDPVATTEKFGLEAGLYKVMTEKPAEGSDGKSRTEQAKELLTKYGSAYLLTSISFAVVSFALCYFAVDNGVDMGAVLEKLGLQPSDKNETMGTAAIAYAAHKALSPVRFPPTVALTPVVAKFLGKKKEEGDSSEKSS